MRRAVIAGSLFLMTVACSSGSTPTAAHSPIPSAAPSPSTTSSLAPFAIAPSYGLLIVSGYLELITPDGAVGPKVVVAPSSVKACSANLDALLAPPVSATSDKVFYRNGDTNIRYVTPAGATADATTVPGGPTAVSFFSVSPDDQRIAVLVEDFVPVNTIGIRLYVEDLAGGGHHTEIYSSTTPKSSAGATLWPMGWHAGRLILAVMPTCSSEPALTTPSEWHVADPATGNRLATIRCKGVLSNWPSPSGVACLDEGTKGVKVFDWTGRVSATTQATAGMLSASLEPWQTGLSPSGQKIFYASKVADPAGCTYPCPGYSTDINASYTQGYLRYAFQYNYLPACLWIDETHLLGPDTALALTLDDARPSNVLIAAIELPARGQCAGRFPGSL